MNRFKIITISFGLTLGFFGAISGQVDGDGRCCDPDMSDYQGPTAPCQVAGFSPTNCVNDEPTDCFGVIDPNSPACTIPIDGGLSLLALAGGGLATAAMRRRREEEAVQEVV